MSANHFRIIEFEGLQFLIQWCTMRGEFLVTVEYYYKDFPYLMEYEFSNWEEQMEMFYNINDEMCMEIYKNTLTSLN